MKLRPLLLSIFLMSSCAVAPVFAQFKDPDADKQLREILPAPFYESLPSKIRLLVWNIEKGLAKDAWANDFKHLADASDVVVVQEGMYDAYSTPVLKTLSQFGWWLAVSWIQLSDNAESGVLTGATTNPLEQKILRASGREPVSQTGKMSLLSFLPLEGGRTLLVVNLHGINFVPNFVWADQIRALEEAIQSFDGPAIVAGDFNTWNGVRMDFLDKALAKQNYKRVKFSKDPRNMVLDHVYLRGCTATEQAVLGNISSSDHFPITMNLNCE